ncbi:TonB-dependent receptor [Rhizorhabdus wittichii]|uniref:TonB-dependent receptor n=1 Tax=Rhizorhabdus wittichii TaxID=160791 RepID=A0A975D6T9_9SPHN|nr:TonB-dependent receptor [Rhizorhabdus wittichii]QTH23829.1 TonB-dependent receptor [Rhizorhabdus wittichii]
MLTVRGTSSARLRCWLLLGSAMLGSPALAQGVSPVPDAASAPAEDIVVTGSRIARKDLTSSSPLVAIAPSALKTNASVTLDDTLTRLPQVTPSYGSGSNDTSTGGTTTVALRGLGAQRTLVLLNGRRLTAGTYTGAVDLNMIPTALIESIEVITGGASAAYGSDAIAGVINFRLKKNFEGVQLDGQTGITSRGDGFTSSLSLTAGGNFAEDRGNAVLSVDYAKRRGVSNRSRAFSRISRPSGALPFGVYVPSALNLPAAGAVDGVFAGYGVAPGSVGPNSNLSFNANGSLFAPTSGINYDGSGQDIVRLGNGVFYNSTGVSGLTIPLERFGLFGRAEYEVADDINVYAEGGYQHFTSSLVFGPGFNTLTVPTTNPFIPDDLRTVLASRPNPNASFSVLRRYADVGQRTADFTTNSYRLLAGVTGRIEAIDGTFDVFASRGEQTVDRRDHNGVNLTTLNALINAADGGASQCAGGYDPFALNGGAACATLLRSTTIRNTKFKQNYVEANVQGRLFSWWAGDVRFALGADRRSDSYDFQPDTGVRTGQILGIEGVGVPAVNGSVTVKEVFGELLVPILRDLPLVKAFDVTLGYRYSDYDLSGGVDAYRIEGDWRVIDALRIRGGFSRAVRAPNVSELFTPQSPLTPIIGAPGAPGQGDPCDVRSAYRTGANAAQVRALCLAQGVPGQIIDSYTFNNTQLVDGGITGGNPKLKPESANTYTIGAVLTPRLPSSILSNLSLSVDYYSIDLKKAIGAIPGAAIVQQCYNLGGANSGYATDNVYCSAIGRSDQTGQINRLESFNVNLGRIKTSGIDVSLGGTIRLGDDAGAIDLSGTVNWTEKYAVTNFPGARPMDLAGSIGSSAGSNAGTPAAFPEWRAQANLTYRNGPFQVGVQYRYIDKMIDVSAIGIPNSTAIGTPAYHYVDLNTQLKIDERLTFRLGVTNLTDKQPPVYTSFYQSNTYPGVYDVLGRSFYAGATVKF